MLSRKHNLNVLANRGCMFLSYWKSHVGHSTEHKRSDNCRNKAMEIEDKMQMEQFDTEICPPITWISSFFHTFWFRFGHESDVSSSDECPTKGLSDWPNHAFNFCTQFQMEAVSLSPNIHSLLFCLQEKCPVQINWLKKKIWMKSHQSLVTMIFAPPFSLEYRKHGTITKPAFGEKICMYLII